MTAPPPLDPTERALLDAAKRIQPAADAERTAGWQRLARATDRPAMAQAWRIPAIAAAASFAAVFTVHAVIGPRPRAESGQTVAKVATSAPAQPAKATSAAEQVAWSVQTLGEGPVPAATVRIRAGTKVQIASESRITLDDGLICAQVVPRDVPVQGPLVVATPQVQVIVVGTQFCVGVDHDVTTVSVQEGRVRVENRDGAKAMIGAGESLRSNGLALQDTSPAAPATGGPAAAAEETKCPSGGPLQPREDCLARIAEGSGLAAQNALFALAVLARDEGHDRPAAISFFRSYLGRFPDSPLAPEASLASVAALRAEKRDAEALAETNRYLARYAQAGRADEVELLRANLLRERLGQPQEAIAAYAHVAETSQRAPLRDEAAFGKALAILDLGQIDAAHQALVAYLRAFPNGAHAAEAARLRAGQEGR